MIVRELLTVLGYRVEEGKLRRANRQVQAYTRTAQRAAVANTAFSSGLASLATRFLGLAAAAVAARQLVTVNVTFERLQSSLETITRSADGARAAMDRMVNLAATTPFALENVTDAFIQLGAAGLDNSDRALTAMGDMASAFGADISESVTAVRSAAFGEMEPLKRFGIIARVEGDRLAVTFDGVTQTIERDAATIQAHLINLAEQRYAGQMGRQMLTLGGIISNLKDNITLFFREIGEAGVADAMRKVLQALRDMFAGSGTIAHSIGKILTPALELLAITLEWIGDNIELVKALFLLFIGFKIVAGIQFLYAAVVALGTGLTAATVKAALFQAALVGILVIIPLLIEDFIVWLEGGESMIGDFVDRFTGEGGILGALAEMAEWLKTDGVAAWEVFKNELAGIIEWLDDTFGDFFRNMFENIRQAIEGLMELGRIQAATRALEREEEIAALDEELAQLQQQRLAVARYQAERADVFGEMTMEERMAGLVTAQERAARARRAGLAIEADMFGAQGGVAMNVGMEGLAPAAVARGVGQTSNNVSVGEVSVTIEGTTGMGPEEVSAAVATGVSDAMNPALRQAERLTSEAGNVF